MGNEKDQLITSNFGHFILGGVPPVPPVPTVEIPESPIPEVKKDVGLPQGTTPDGFANDLNNNPTFKAYRANADYADYGFNGDLVKYSVDYLQAGWFKDEKAKKNYMAWDTIQNLLFLAFHESKNPADQAKAGQAFLENFKGYAATVQQFAKDTKADSSEDGVKRLKNLAEAQRRLANLAGLYLKDLKSDGQPHAEEALVLTLLRDTYKTSDEAFGRQDDATKEKFKPIREYTQARALYLEIALTPPEEIKPGELRKKIGELKTHLKKAKESLKDDSPMKDAYQPLIEAEIAQFPATRSDASMAQEFITRNTASVVMMVASEIDMENGDNQETVKNRYQVLTGVLTDYISKNPETTFSNALDQLNTDEAGHLKGLLGSHKALRDLKDAEQVSKTFSRDKTPDALVGAWANQVIAVINDHSSFSTKMVEGGEFHAASYQEILSQFIGIQGVKLSPFSQSYQDFIGGVPGSDEARSKAANEQLLSMGSTGSKVLTGVAHTLGLKNIWKTLLFAGAASVLQRGINTGMVTIAGESGSFGKGIFTLVKNGELTGLGNFTAGSLTGIGLTAGGSGYQFIQDSNAGRETHFWHDMAVGSIISTAGLGLAQLGNYGVRKIWLDPWRREAAEAGLALPFWKRALPYAAHVGIATGGMVTANALYRGLWHNPMNPNQKVPLVSADEVTETTLNMIAMNLVEVLPLNRLFAEKQLGKFRTKQLNSLTDELMAKHYGSPGQSSPYAAEVNLSDEGWSVQRKMVFNRLALEALRGVPLKDLQTDPFKAHIAKILKLPSGPGGTLGSAAVVGAPAGAAVTGPRTFVSEDGSEIQIGIRLGKIGKPFKVALRTGEVRAEVTKIEEASSHPKAVVKAVKVTLKIQTEGQPAVAEHTIQMSADHVEALKMKKGMVYKLDAFDPAELTPLPAPGGTMTGTSGLPENAARAKNGTAYLLEWVPSDPSKARLGEPPNAIVKKVEEISHDDVRVTIEWTNSVSKNKETLIFEMPVSKADDLGLEEGENFRVSHSLPPVGSPPVGGRASPPPAPAAPPASGGTLAAGRKSPVPPPPPGARPKGPPPLPPAARPKSAPPAPLLPEGVFKTLEGWHYEVKPVEPSHEAMQKALSEGYQMAKVTQIEHDPTGTEITAHVETFATADTASRKFVIKMPRDKSDPLGILPNSMIYVKHYVPPAALPPPVAPPPPPKPEPLPVITAIGGNAFDADNNWEPRRAQVNVVIPGVGEVAGFTHEGIDKGVLSGQRANPVNEDGFGVDPNTGLIVVGDGMGGMGFGDQASAVTVKSILDIMATGEHHLGSAFLLTHENVFSQCQGGGCATSAIHPLPDGTVEVAQAGDTRIFLFRPKGDGTYDVIEPYHPDSMATYYRFNPPQTPEELQQIKDHYKRLELSDDDFQLGNTLQMNASSLNSIIRSALGLPGGIRTVNGKPGMVSMPLTLVPELDFSKASPQGQVLYAPLSIPDPANPGKRILYIRQDGDVLGLMSDGVADLLNKQQMANTIKNDTDVGRMAAKFQQVSKRFLGHWNVEAQGLAGGERGQLPNNGAFIDSKGNLYASDDPRDTTIIGHFGPDNITAVLLKFGAPKEAPKAPPPPPPQANPNEPTPAEGVRAADVDDQATTQQFTRSTGPNLEDTSDTDTTLKRPSVVAASIEPPPAPTGDEAVCKVDDPNAPKGTPVEFDRSGTTLVGENNPLRIKEILEGIKIKWMKDNLKPNDHYILINLAMMSGGPAFDHGKAIERVTSCMENQILVKIERDPSGERRLYLVDNTLGLLANALKMKPEQVQKMVEAVFPPIDTLDVEPDSASGARPIPAAPKGEEKGTAPQERSRGDVTAQISLETVLGLQIQEALVPYFSEVQKGVVKTGKIYIYRVDNTYTAKWKSEDSVSEVLVPENSKLVAVVRVKGDLTKQLDAHQVLPAPEMPTNDPRYRTLLGKIHGAVEMAVRQTIQAQEAK